MGIVVDPTELCGILRNIKGKFLLSYNDHPDIRKIFRGFKIRTAKSRYSVSIEETKNDTVHELLIMFSPSIY